MTRYTHLGSHQLDVLECLKLGGWSIHCGWHLRSPSRTIVILESLVRRGLVTKTVTPGHPDLYQRSNVEIT